MRPGSRSVAVRKEDYEALASFRSALRRFLRFSSDAARAAGITPQQHQLLLAVLGRPGRSWAHVAELAEALQLSPHAAVGLLDRCVKAGLARRSRDPEDGRQVRVSVRPKGKRILAALSARHREELAALRSHLRLPLLGEPPRARRRR